MSHELEIQNGVASMAYVGEKPWHGLGVELQPGATPQEMMQAANLEWSVETVTAYYDFKGKKYKMPTKPLVRSTDGMHLTDVGEDWNPVQNAEAFDFFNEFVKRGDMTMETAGSLFDGQIVWALAKVRDSFELFGGDKVDAYLLFTNPHKYGQTTSVQFNPIRVVCNNTLTMAFSQKVQNIVRVSHRAKFDPENVKTLLGITHQKLDKYKDAANFLGSRKAEKENVIEFLRQVFPRVTSKDKEASKELSKTAKKAFEALESQPGANFAPGSWWNAFNAVTYTADHLAGRKQDTRLASAWYGPNRQRKITALSLAVDFADKSPLLKAA